MANIHSLSSVKNDSSANSNDDDDRLYVGGTDGHGGGSGLSVIGPPEGAAASILAQARSQSVENDDIAAGRDPSGLRIITFYQNGFTVDNGPLRILSDLDNKSFIEDIQKGIVPRELEGEANGGATVPISLADRRHEVYAGPTTDAITDANTPAVYTAFSGTGQSMGASTPTSTSGIMQSGSSATREDASLPIIDTTQPLTTLSIRLHTGKRLKVTVNTTHTISHLQAIIAAESPDDIRPYVLLAGYPPKPLLDLTLTMSEANVSGSSLTQKLA